MVFLALNFRNDDYEQIDYFFTIISYNPGM
jgi:hypothetical protein